MGKHATGPAEAAMVDETTTRLSYSDSAGMFGTSLAIPSLSGWALHATPSTVFWRHERT
jgi:hypothetical protein